MAAPWWDDDYPRVGGSKQAEPKVKLHREEYKGKQLEEHKGEQKLYGEHKARHHNGKMKDMIHADYGYSKSTDMKQHEHGYAKVYDRGYEHGYVKVSDRGYEHEYVKVYDRGYEHGHEKVYDRGYEHGHEKAYDRGYEHGYDSGYAHGSDYVEYGHDNGGNSEYGDHGSEYVRYSSNDSGYDYDDDYEY